MPESLTWEKQSPETVARQAWPIRSCFFLMSLNFSYFVSSQCPCTKTFHNAAQAKKQETVSNPTTVSAVDGSKSSASAPENVSSKPSAAASGPQSSADSDTDGEIAAPQPVKQPEHITPEKVKASWLAIGHWTLQFHNSLFCHWSLAASFQELPCTNALDNQRTVML